MTDLGGISRRMTRPQLALLGLGAFAFLGAAQVAVASPPRRELEVVLTARPNAESARDAAASLEFVSLHASLAAEAPARVVPLSEWATGRARLDELAAALRVQVSALLREARGRSGPLSVDDIVALVPLDERLAAARDEALARGTNLDSARVRAVPRRLEDLAPDQRGLVVALADALAALRLEPGARAFGDRVVNVRRSSEDALHALRRAAPGHRGEELAIRALAEIADADRDGRFTPLWTDGGAWSQRRVVAEGDLRNARTCDLDDDNGRAVAQLFEQAGLTERALFLALVRAVTEPGPGREAATSPDRAAALIETLRERAQFVFFVAHPGKRPRPGVAEREYLARLSALRLPGEGLDSVLRRELLGDADVSLARGVDADLRLASLDPRAAARPAPGAAWTPGLRRGREAGTAFTEDRVRSRSAGGTELHASEGSAPILDVLVGRRGASTLRGGIELSRLAPSARLVTSAAVPGTARRLFVHGGLTAGDGGLTPGAGVSARAGRGAWSAEMSLGLTSSGAGAWVGVVRDVAAVHDARLAAVFSTHQSALAGGRGPFLGSLAAPGAEGAAALAFMESLGWSPQDLLSDEDAFLALHESYAFERDRQRAELVRGAPAVAFAGFGIGTAGGPWLVAGPRLAVKDVRVQSRVVDYPDLEDLSDEAVASRDTIATGSLPATGWSTTRETVLGMEADASGRATARVEAARVESSAVAADAEDLSRAEAAAVLRVNEQLAARGVPLGIRASDVRHEFVVEPRGVTPHAAVSYELHVARQRGLALLAASDGLPRLIAPRALDAVVLDWMADVKTVTRRGESDELHRVTLALSPGPTPAELVRESAAFLRMEVVDGRVVGTMRMASGLVDEQGRTASQPNVLSHSDEGVEGSLAHLRSEAAGRASSQPASAPLGNDPNPRASDPGYDVLREPAAMPPALLARLRGLPRADVQRFKINSIAHAARRASGTEPPDQLLAPANVAQVQSMAIEEAGRPLAGRALEHAHFIVLHEGLLRADGGAVSRQVATLRYRAITPFALDREMGRAEDPRARRLVQLAGVDEAAALGEIRAGMREMADSASATGALPRQLVPQDTTLTTLSTTSQGSGVQSGRVSEPVEAHLLPAMPLTTNAGRWIAAVLLSQELSALDARVDEELLAVGAGPLDLDTELLPAIAAALADPRDERTLSVSLPGGELEIAFDDAPRAGALARCKNATLFLPPKVATMRTTRAVPAWVEPFAVIGRAREDARFIGIPRLRWTPFAVLAGLPWLRGGSPPAAVAEPPPPAGTPREGQTPTGRSGGREHPPDRPGVGEEPGSTSPREGRDVPAAERGTRDNPPDRPIGSETTTTPPRDGEDVGGGARPGRGEPPGRPDVEEEGDTTTPRDGTRPPGADRPPRVGPPDRPPFVPPTGPGREGELPPDVDRPTRPDHPGPSDRPRRPVD